MRALIHLRFKRSNLVRVALGVIVQFFQFCKHILHLGILIQREVFKRNTLRLRIEKRQIDLAQITGTFRGVRDAHVRRLHTDNLHSARHRAIATRARDGEGVSARLQKVVHDTNLSVVSRVCDAVNTLVIAIVEVHTEEVFCHGIPAIWRLEGLFLTQEDVDVSRDVNEEVHTILLSATQLEVLNGGQVPGNVHVQSYKFHLLQIRRLVVPVRKQEFAFVTEHGTRDKIAQRLGRHCHKVC
ncbi:hypothetical protein DQ04_07681020 [Trypanosoma grayi]|uniref:hypothetical protein n=1 Tax=Trypanosoma grayi TaxID=71804 RepID=UPI0004F45229|nr:hypothetical protein DQ04_07681020 [Trypanosoma grayi]KEG08226.1 hypothetical protein DQ04_07681020 [Trypanosoma grayi]